MTSITPELMRHHTAMRRLATRLVMRDEVDDVVQETMARALQDPPRGDLGAWLASVLRNVVRFRRRSDTRRRQREALVAQPDAASGREPADALHEMEAAERISRVLRELPDPYRAVLVQRYFLQRSLVDIARELGLREDAVRQRHKRGLDMMRSALAKRGANGASPLTRARLAALFTPWLQPTAPAAAGNVAKVAGICAALFSITTMKTKVALTVAAVVALASLSAYALWDPSTPAPMAPVQTSNANAAGGELTSGRESRETAAQERVEITGAAGDPSDPAAIGPGVDIRVVWDDDGTPASGQKVHLNEYDQWESGSLPKHSEITCKDGIASFRGLRETRYVAEGRFRPVQRTPQVIEVTAATLDEEPFEIRIRRGTTVTGRVVDPRGRGIAGAAVLRAGWAASWTKEIGVTDADGTFEIGGLHGRISMGARAPGFAPSVMLGMNLNDKKSDTLEIELQPAAANLTVKVVGPNGAPVADAHVAVGIFGRQTQPRRGAAGRDEHVMPAHTKTDASGVDELGGLLPGTWSLEAKAKGMSGFVGKVEVPELHVGGQIREIVREVQLPELIVIEGRALDGNGASLAKVYVGYGRHGHLVYGGTSTKDDGSYRLAGAPAGKVRMRAQRKGLDRRETIETAAGRTYQWNPEFAAERKVPGSVRWDDGKAVAHAGLSVWSIDAKPRWHASDHADEQGNFVLEMPEHVKSVRVQVRTLATFYQVVHEGPLPSGSFDIVLGPEHKPSSTLRGRVVSPDGKPLGGADLWYSLVGQGNGSPIEVGADGRFEQKVTPGEYGLGIEVAGFARARKSVEVGIEEDKDLGDLTLEHPAAIRLTVDGAPDGEMTFWLTHVESERRSRLPIVNGVGSVGGLPGGNYRVQVCGDQIASESLEVFLQSSPGGGTPTEVRVLARPARPLQITLKLAAGAERPRRRSADIEILDADGRLAVRHRASISSNNTIYTRFALAIGRYQVRVRERELSAEAAIEIEAAGKEPKAVELELR